MIVTLSRMMGSGGDAIAAAAATALGLKLIDRERVYRAALQAGLPEDLLARLFYESSRSLAAEILDSLGGGPAQAHTTPLPQPLAGIFVPALVPASASLEEVATAVGKVIEEIASQDNVLLLGQGGQYLLQRQPRACHVQVMAPFEARVAKIAQSERMNLGAARRAVRNSDRARNDYLARYYGINWTDPAQYHLVINTALMPVDAAVAIVIAAARAIAG